MYLLSYANYKRGDILFKLVNIKLINFHLKYLFQLLFFNVNV